MKECQNCRDPKAGIHWRHEMLNRRAFVIDYITDDCKVPTGFNCHTHGLGERYGHQNFQIVYPLFYRQCKDIFEGLVAKIRRRKRFEAGKFYGGIVDKYDITMIEVTEGGQWFLRLILPGRDGVLDVRKMKHPYHMQYDF